MEDQNLLDAAREEVKAMAEIENEMNAEQAFIDHICKETAKEIGNYLFYHSFTDSLSFTLDSITYGIKNYVIPASLIDELREGKIELG